MAEEGTLGLARASGANDGDDEPSKEELQRRMEEARETITQTVTEIKETVTNQYYTMKETVTDALDWRHHFRKNPIAFSVGALSVGFLVGYGLAGSLKGGGDDRREDYPSSEESDVYARTGATPPRYEDYEDAPERHSAFHGHSYAAQPITDKPEASDYRPGSGGEDADEGDTGDYARAAGASMSYSAPGTGSQETPQKPGLYERFKETSAYDRLQSEVSSLGDRFIEELSSTAHNVVLPALFNKIKELFGVDLSGKQGQQTQQQGRQAGQGSGAQAGTSTAARAATASASSGASGSPRAASYGSSSAQSYATSENRGYGAQSGDRGAESSGGRAGGDDASSVLDLDR
ncbi:MAG TPA: hypothetical protein VJT09_12520 [Pyrinomonadaceae bacterium]|nr:hypothetical protein [Pyrinomonadaceae bacterium]